MFKHIQAFYKANGMQSKLGKLTKLAIRSKASKSPKLKAKAGELRCLVPWCITGSHQLFVQSSTCAAAASYLKQVYECLSVDCFDPCKFKSAGIKFLTLCLALEQIVGQASCTWGLETQASFVCAFAREKPGQPKPMVDLQG